MSHKKCAFAQPNPKQNNIYTQAVGQHHDVLPKQTATQVPPQTVATHTSTPHRPITSRNQRQWRHLVPGAWRSVLGAWCLVPGVCCLVPAAWCLDPFSVGSAAVVVANNPAATAATGNVNTAFTYRLIYQHYRVYSVVSTDTSKLMVQRFQPQLMLTIMPRG